MERLTAVAAYRSTMSIRLPADWHVVQTGVAFIRAQGPNGELAIFGIAVPAHDAPSTAVTPAGVNQPYAVELKDKLTQSLGWVLERLGKGAVPVNILSDTSLPPGQSGANAGRPQQAGASQGTASASSPQRQATALVSLQQTQIATQLMMAQVNAINSSTNYAMQSANVSFNTFDHNLRGDTPVYGTNSSQPLFWVGD